MRFDEALGGLRSQFGGARHAHTGQWVASALRSTISDGALPPGTKLLEEPLCLALGVSRNTLREAFGILGAENIVTRLPNRGVFVARPSAADIREIYRVRRYLEPAALRWCVAGSGDPDDVRLEEILGRARAGLAAGDVGVMAGANQDFHRWVVARAGSARFDALMSQVLAEMRLVFHGMEDDPAFHSFYVTENHSIAELLRRGAWDGAAEMMREYLDRAEAQVLAALAAHGAP